MLTRSELEATLKRLAVALEEGVEASTFADGCECLAKRVRQEDMQVYCEWLWSVVQLAGGFRTAKGDSALH